MSSIWKGKDGLRTTEFVFRGMALAASGHHGDEETGARQSGQGDLFKAKEPGENNPNGIWFKMLDPRTNNRWKKQ